MYEIKEAGYGIKMKMKVNKIFMRLETAP